MWLNGTPIVLATVYSVTVNSFLATGGDNFAALATAQASRTPGKTDLQAMVDYMAEFANDRCRRPAAPVPSQQSGIGVTFPAGAPSRTTPGEHVAFDVSSSGPSPVRATPATPRWTSRALRPSGTFTLDNTPPRQTQLFDDDGQATVDVIIPAGTAAGHTDASRSSAATTGSRAHAGPTARSPDGARSLRSPRPT